MADYSRDPNKGALPMVKIKHPDGYAVIGEPDFDPAVHERFDEPAAPPPPPVLPPPPAGAPDPLDNLPANWREDHGARLKSIAAAISGGRAVENKDQAIAVIESALAARGK
ncbi:hypothetical protein ACQR1I_36315 [Bradyrhizobium sp. HKCCYLS2038]|uniref:hypothetical protein n=1 Tax=Bradyrhizobium sp. HKCCYLS2038 TaxID=3420764 RepID=UPI003EB908C5